MYKKFILPRFTDVVDEGLFNGLILLGEISKRKTPLLLAFLIKAKTSKKSITK
jgi:hypothetical protein